MIPRQILNFSTPNARPNLTSPVPTAQQNTAPSSGLSSGAKAGIGVGVALGIIAIVVAIGFFVWKARSRRTNATAELPNTTDGRVLHELDWKGEPPELDNTGPPQELEGHSPIMIERGLEGSTTR